MLTRVLVAAFVASLASANVHTVEGDVLVDDAIEGRRFARQAEVGKKWKQFPIPISFQSGYPDKQKDSAIAGMKEWEKYTCVRFNLGDASSANRIVIVNGGSCQSYVGQNGGVQTVILGPACNGVSSSSHELGHAIGLQHTQTRADRDQYINIDKTNLNTGLYNLNFKVEPTASTMDIPYDWASIMHYQPKDFAIYPSRPVITPKQHADLFSVNMGNYQLSFYDIARVNRMYNCYDKCSSRVSCSNNGVQDVNNCNQCLCPPGWGGATCSQNPPSARALTATASEQRQEGKVGRTEDDQRIRYDIQDFVVTAPAGKRILIKVDYVWTGEMGLGCKMGGIEIFTKTDTRIGGARVCKMEERAASYTTEGNRAYVRVYGRFSQTSATFTYRAV